MDAPWEILLSSIFPVPKTLSTLQVTLNTWTEKSDE